MSRACMIVVLVGLLPGDVLGVPPVTVEGGPEGIGSNYQWTITNNQTSAIIRLQIPHYRANLFLSPPGWTSTCTNLVNVGAKDQPGLCTAQAESASAGIAPHRSASFGMQIAGGTAKRGGGAVVVGFADGTTHIVEGVLIPVQEGLGDRYIPLVGLAVALAIVLILERRRARKKRCMQADASSGRV